MWWLMKIHITMEKIILHRVIFEVVAVEKRPSCASVPGATFVEIARHCFALNAHHSAGRVGAFRPSIRCRRTQPSICSGNCDERTQSRDSATGHTRARATARQACDAARRTKSSDVPSITKPRSTVTLFMYLRDMLHAVLPMESVAFTSRSTSKQSARPRAASCGW